MEVRDFNAVLDIWCGFECLEDKSMEEVHQLACVADRLQITEVSTALEEKIVAHLNPGNCCDELTWSIGIGMSRLQEAARQMAIRQFEELAGTAGFAKLEEEALGLLLDDDGLCVGSEEAVWESLVAWMTAEEGRLRGRGLVGKIRFALMQGDYLGSRAAGLLPAGLLPT